MRKKLTGFVFVALFAILSINIMRMPGIFDETAPAYNEATRHYLEQSVEETGAVNVIAAVLTDYRAFDTLGETIVLFTAIVAVVSILRPFAKKKDPVGDRNG